MRDWRELGKWKSYEAMEETLRRNTVDVALFLGCSESKVRKWKECPATTEDPDQSGRRNPLDEIERTILAIEEIDLERAYVPIKWLNVRFGFLPPVKAPAGNESDSELLQDLLKWHKEIGETCAALSKALEDGRISRDDFRKCFREVFDDIEAGLTLLAKMQARIE